MQQRRCKLVVREHRANYIMCILLRNVRATRRASFNDWPGGQLTVSVCIPRFLRMRCKASELHLTRTRWKRFQDVRKARPDETRRGGARRGEASCGEASVDSSSSLFSDGRRGRNNLQFSHWYSRLLKRRILPPCLLSRQKFT